MGVDEISESPILAVLQQVFEMRQRGETILGLHVGEPDLETPPGIREAAYRAMNAGMTHYVSAQGLTGLREAIAARLRERHGIATGPQNVVVVPAKFALYATLLATLAPGEEVLLADPTYLLVQPTQLAGGRPIYFELGEGFAFDAGRLEAAVTPRSRVLVLVSPSNPTGRILSADDVRAAVEVARRHGLVIISDETYESLIYEGQHVAPAAHAPPEVEVVTIGSFSKSFAMTGWRVGYAVAPPRIVARLVKIVEHTLTCVPAFIQEAAEWALRNSGADEEAMRTTFRSRRDHLVRRLRSVHGLEFARPEGAFYIFPRYDLPLPSLEFCSQLLQEERLALVPGIAFGPAGEQHIRISYSSSTEALDDGVERLDRFLRRHRK